MGASVGITQKHSMDTCLVLPRDSKWQPLDRGFLIAKRTKQRFGCSQEYNALQSARSDNNFMWGLGVRFREVLYNAVDIQHTVHCFAKYNCPYPIG